MITYSGSHPVLNTQQDLKTASVEEKEYWDVGPMSATAISGSLVVEQKSISYTFLLAAVYCFTAPRPFSNCSCDISCVWGTVTSEHFPTAQQLRRNHVEQNSTREQKVSQLDFAFISSDCLDCLITLCIVILSLKSNLLNQIGQIFENNKNSLH